MRFSFDGLTTKRVEEVVLRHTELEKDGIGREGKTCLLDPLVLVVSTDYLVVVGSFQLSVG